MMDNRDLALTADESLEYLAAAIEELTLEDVFAFFEDSTLNVQYRGEPAIAASGSPDTGKLTVSSNSGAEVFCWDDVEEDWFSEAGTVRLHTRVEQLIQSYTGAEIRIRRYD